MLPSQRYKELMSRKRFKRDLTQEHSIGLLDELYIQLIKREKETSNWFRTLLSRNKLATKGIYLWGGVGRGKTFLMDLFFDVLPIKNKRRIHFHHFMREVHDRLNEIKLEKNPLKLISKQLAREFSVLCLDEFMVHDIGDAMLLSELLASMSEQGIVLLTTSNTAPENLYLDGLQRDQFLATIDHINLVCHVLHVDSGVDYRTLESPIEGIFHAKQSHLSEQYLHEFLHDKYGKPLLEKEIILQNRAVSVHELYEKAVWFEFESICKTHRSRSDYIEIAQRFKLVALSNLHEMDDQANDVIRRFITLIDVLYDAKTTLILSSDVAIEDLYQGEFLRFEFYRTVSRLHEMQQQHYLDRRQ